MSLEDLGFKVMTIQEFNASLTEEIKERSKAKLDEILGDLRHSSPILCGPEGRAAAAGKLDEYYADCEKYNKLVDISYFDDEDFEDE